MTDTNRSGVLGDCTTPVNNWANDCDQLNLSDDYISIDKVVPAADAAPSVSAAQRVIRIRFMAVILGCILFR